jgi:nucleoid-associated protein YgaU
MPGQFTAIDPLAECYGVFNRISWSGIMQRGGKGMAEEMKQREGQNAWDATQWHEVKRGATLSKIAEQYYGDSSLYPKIFEANRDILDNPNLIKIGQKLRIP